MAIFNCYVSSPEGNLHEPSQLSSLEVHLPRSTEEQAQVGHVNGATYVHLLHLAEGSKSGINLVPGGWEKKNRKKIPSGKLTKSYWTYMAIDIVSFPMKNGDFP